MNLIQLTNTNLAYTDEGNGEILLFLHGWGQSAESFNYFTNELKEKFRVVAIDFPGFGNSPTPNSGWELADYTKVLEEFIAQLNLKNYTIIAHSFGARVAYQHAQNTDQIKKIIVTGGAGLKEGRNLTYYRKVYHYKLLKKISQLPIYERYNEILINGSGSTDYKNANEIMKKVLINVVNQDLTKEIQKIKIPVLLYWGEKDDTTSLKTAKKMKKYLVNSKLIVRPGEGHFSYLESKEEFLKEIQQFT